MFYMIQKKQYNIFGIQHTYLIVLQQCQDRLYNLIYVIYVICYFTAQNLISKTIYKMLCNRLCTLLSNILYITPLPKLNSTLCEWYATCVLTSNVLAYAMYFLGNILFSFEANIMQQSI